MSTMAEILVNIGNNLVTLIVCLTVQSILISEPRSFSDTNSADSFYICLAVYTMLVVKTTAILLWEFLLDFNVNLPLRSGIN